MGEDWDGDAMSFCDPESQARGYRGFYDPSDLQSILRCIRADAAHRLFQQAQGELHLRILFESVADLYEWADAVAAQLPEDQQSSAQLFLSQLAGCLDGAKPLMESMPGCDRSEVSNDDD